MKAKAPLAKACDMLTVAEVATRCNKKNNVEERALINTLAKISRRSADRNKTLGDTLANVKFVAVVEKNWRHTVQREGQGTG